MQKKPIAVAISSGLAILIAGCASTPTPVVPDGSKREPINSPQKIEAYKAQTADETHERVEKSRLESEVESLDKQLAEVRAYIAMLEIEKAANAPKTSPAPQPEAPAKTKKTVRKAMGKAGDSIEIREQSIVFRVTHPFAHTEFEPSAEVEQELLKAAREAKHIDIRGRTDAAHDDAIDRDIALQRALHARRFLVRNGIEPSKIRWSSMASGGYVADNSTPDGRAQNRRVEIETMDLDAAAFAEDSAVIKLGSAK